MTNTAQNIQSYMTTDLIAVNPQATVDEARKLFTSNLIRHLPVVDKNGVVVGILSDRDLGRAASTLEIAFLMSAPSKVLSINDGFHDVIDVMLQSKVSSCLIEDGGKLVGIVTSEDLLRVLKDHLEKPSRGSMRTVLYDYVSKYPLGSAMQMLSNAGI